MPAHTPRWLTAVTRSKFSIGSSGGVRRRHLDACIVERHVEPAVLCDCTIDHRRDLRLVGDVAGDADGDAALADDPLCLLRGKIPVKIRQHNRGAALGEHPRRCQPMPLPAPVTSATWPLKS
jgi:hypothetical protein